MLKKQPILAIYVILFFSLMQIAFTSCKKTSDNKPPTVVFVNKTGYISTNTNVAKHTVFVIGIEATKNGNDLIQYVNLLCSYNNRPDTLIDQVFLPGTGTSYNRDYYLNSGDTAYGERYTVEVHSYLQLVSTLTLTVNVQ